MRAVIAVAALAIAGCGPSDLEKTQAEIKKIEAEIAAGEPADGEPGRPKWVETRNDRLRWLKTLEELEREKQQR